MSIPKSVLKPEYLLLPIIALHLCLLAITQFTAWPEMLAYPYLYNNGYTLYRDFIYPYPPLLTWLLAALYSAFGTSAAVLRGFGWSLAIVNDILIFTIASRLTSTRYALLATAFFALLSPVLEGNMVWFDTIVVTPVLCSVYFLSRYLSRDKWSNGARNELLIAGIIITLAVLIKQTAALFFIVSAFYIVSRRPLFHLIYFLTAPVVLALVFLAALLSTGTLSAFFTWNLILPFTFWSSFPGYVQMALNRREAIVLALLLVPVAVSLIAGMHKKTILLLWLLIAALVAVYPRFSFFHLQSALAFISIFVGIAAGLGKREFAILSLAILLLLMMAYRPTAGRSFFVEPRFVATEDVRLADEIASIVDKDERVFLLGVHAGIYVLADRLPPKPWTDNFGWYLEAQGIQEEILARWENEPPEYIVWQEAEPGEWYELGTYSPRKITDWITERYTMVERLENGAYIWRSN